MDNSGQSNYSSSLMSVCFIRFATSQAPIRLRFIHRYRLIGCLLTLLCPQLWGIDYAQNFELSDHVGYRLLTIRNSQPDSNYVQRYALVPREQPHPRTPEDATVILTPVKRVVTMETVYIGYLEALGQLNRIVAAGTTDFITEPGVRQRVANGKITSLQVGQSLDIEKLLLLQPDLILTSISGDPAFDVPTSIRRAGLPVVLTAGYLEASPLARAEWIRCIGAFFEADELAEEIFSGVALRYESLKAKTEDATNRPTVFSGAPYSGAWYVPAGESYTARAIRDAGGDYLWADVARTGAIPLNTERVFLKAAQADFWINPSHYQSLDELFAADPRFSQFDAAVPGRIFNNTRQVGPNGGNAIWERGVVHPDEVLADLIKVFHPELLPNWDFVFYEPLN